MSSSYTTITGTDTANTIIVDTTGDDSVKALGGNDTVTGSGGNDIVDLAGGNDLVTQAGDYTGGTIYGGAGNIIPATLSRLQLFMQVLTMTPFNSVEMPCLRQASQAKPAETL